MRAKDLITFFILGIFFGFILMKAEVISWFRIQEMFFFDSFHMYGVIGSAIVVGALGILWIKKSNVKDSDGNPITIPPKDPSQVTRYIVGGSIFGLGWSLIGACPAPMFTLVGAGATVFVVPILTAILGTYVYGMVRHQIPH